MCYKRCQAKQKRKRRQRRSGCNRKESKNGNHNPTRDGRTRRKPDTETPPTKLFLVLYLKTSESCGLALSLPLSLPGKRKIPLRIEARRRGNDMAHKRRHRKKETGAMTAKGRNTPTNTPRLGQGLSLCGVGLIFRAGGISVPASSLTSTCPLARLTLTQTKGLSQPGVLGLSRAGSYISKWAMGNRKERPL